MKNCTLKSNVQNNFDFSQKESLKKPPKKTKTSSKAAKSTMTEQLAIPPARVWDKIEKILDEQDDRIKKANTLIDSCFTSRF
jgi:hypothetical protein